MSAIEGCISSVAAAKPAQFTAMVVVDGATARCFVTLSANGAVTPVRRCRDTIPRLGLARSWHWQGDDLLIMAREGRVLMFFKLQAAGHWRADFPSGPALHLYRMTPEAKPL